MRIMIIDDSESMRNICKEILAQLGYMDIIEACDGREAQKKIKIDKPDLILLDWNMPHVDGLTFLVAYRKKNKTTPVIMMTTESDKDQVIKAIRAGITSYVLKPFEAPELVQRIKSAFDKSSKRKSA